MDFRIFDYYKINKKNYLELNQCGGNIKTGFVSFKSQFTRKMSHMIDIVNADIYLRNIISNNDKKFMFNKDNISKYIIPIFLLILISLDNSEINKLDSLVKKITDNNLVNDEKLHIIQDIDEIVKYVGISLVDKKFIGNNIDWICQLYLDNRFTLNNSNSIKNINEFKTLIFKLNQINNNKNNQKVSELISQNNIIIKPINEFGSLSELDEFIKQCNRLGIFSKIKEIQESKLKKKSEEKTKKLLGENDMAKVFESDIVIIYTPTTEAGACYYGRNTKWCTASKINNLFTKYTENDKKLYIIESKKDLNDKYQIQFNELQLRNPKDEIVKISELINKFNDNQNKFADFIYNNYLRYNYGSTDDTTDVIYKKYISKMLTYSPLDKITKINFDLGSNTEYGINVIDFLPLKNEILNELKKYKRIKIAPTKIDIRNFLDEIQELEYLELNLDNYEYDISDSLSKMTKLKSLLITLDNYGYDIFNKLSELSSLEFLYIKLKNYNYNISDRLRKMTSLTKLTIDTTNYKYDLSNAISNLKNLEFLTIKNPNADYTKLSEMENLITINIS